MSRSCPHCGAPDYGTPFCVSCQRPFVRDAVAPPAAAVPDAVAPAALVPAGFFRRFFAFALDWIILSVLADLLSFAYRLGTGSSEGMMSLNASLILSFVIFLLYFTLLTGEGGQTLGKMVLGIRVVAEEGTPVRMSRALVRTLSYILSSFLFCLGFLWALWDKRKQAWHDKVAGTIVIRV